MKDSEIYKKHLKSLLKSLSQKELIRLTGNELPKALTKKEVRVINDLAFLIGEIQTHKKQFTKIELHKFMKEALVWVFYELFLRLEIAEFDKKSGNLKHNKIGRKVLATLNINSGGKTNDI